MCSQRSRRSRRTVHTVDKVVVVTQLHHRCGCDPGVVEKMPDELTAPFNDCLPHVVKRLKEFAIQSLKKGATLRHCRSRSTARNESETDMHTSKGMTDMHTTKGRTDSCVVKVQNDPIIPRLVVGVVEKLRRRTNSLHPS